MRYPRWVQEGNQFIRAEWGPRSEEAESVSVRSSRFLAATNDLLGVTEAWTNLRTQEPLAIDQQTIDEFVLESIYRNDGGMAVPGGGFSFAVFARGRNGVVSIQVNAGSALPSTRIAANSVLVKPSGPTHDGAEYAMSVELIEALLHVTVEAWEPVSAAAYDSVAAVAAASRGARAAVAGQRTWVSESIGKIEEIPDGVTVDPAPGGVYLATDDELRSDEAAALIVSALDANNVARVPSGERSSA